MKKCIEQVKKGLAVLLMVVMVMVTMADIGMASNLREPWEPGIENGTFYSAHSFVSISDAFNFERTWVGMNNEEVLTAFERQSFDPLREEAKFFGIFLRNLYRVQVNAPAVITIHAGGAALAEQTYLNSPMVGDVRYTVNPYTGGYAVEPGSTFTIPANAQVGDQFVVITVSNPGVGWGAEMFFIEVVGGGTTAPQPTPQPTPPPAETPSSWAREHVQRANDLGLVPANLNSAFTQAATRAEFSALAVALYETVTGRTITERANFNDTTDINVQKMGGLGVVTGVGGGNFNPNGTITREQAAVLVARLAYAIGQPLPPSAPTFADNNSISSWAIDGVGQMQASGIMGGVGNNNFAPRGQYTREQSIVSMLRLFDILD